MASNKKLELLRKLARYGVLHRNEVRGYEDALAALLKREFVRPTHRDRKRYYELTSKALPLLESMREQLVGELKTNRELHPKSRVYKALLDDVRFVDPNNPNAQKFLFLNSLNLMQEVVPSRLLLSRERYYESQAL